MNGPGGGEAAGGAGASLDVTDLFVAFHNIAQSIWRDFGFAVDDESWDDIIDALEMDLFLSACVHRLLSATSEALEPDEVPQRIRLIKDGAEVVGGGGQYHSHAFYPDPDTNDVPCAVMTGNLMSRSLPDVRLVITPGVLRIRPRGRQLPQVS